MDFKANDYPIIIPNGNFSLCAIGNRHYKKTGADKAYACILFDENNIMPIIFGYSQNIGLTYEIYDNVTDTVSPGESATVESFVLSDNLTLYYCKLPPISKFNDVSRVLLPYIAILPDEANYGQPTDLNDTALILTFLQYYIKSSCMYCRSAYMATHDIYGQPLKQSFKTYTNSTFREVLTFNNHYTCINALQTLQILYTENNASIVFRTSSTVDLNYFISTPDGWSINKPFAFEKGKKYIIYTYNNTIMWNEIYDY